MTQPILITGAGRCGSSMVAGLFVRHGAWVGTTVGAGPGNLTGFFENFRIRQRVVKEMIKARGGHPIGQVRFQLDYKAEPTLKKQIDEILRDQKYEHGPWIIKDAKLTSLWREFNDAYPRALWVGVMRDPDKIADSCMETPFMHAHNTKQDWLANYVIPRLEQWDELKSNVWRWCEVWPQKIIDGDYWELEYALHKGGLELDPQTIEGFVVKAEWHF